MSSLRERFENHNTQPDPEVWNRIEKTMHHRTVVRRTVVSSVAVVALAAAALFWPKGPDTKPVQVAQMETPEVVVATSPVSVEDPISAVSEETMPAQSREQMSKANSPKPAAESNAEENRPAQSQPVASVAAQPVASVAATPVRQNVTVDPIVATASQPTASEHPTVSAATTERPAAPAPKLAQSDENKAGSTDLIVWIPNVFSPDDEVAENKVFKVKPNSEANIRSFEMYIYNRGGRQVFHSKDINQGWDGRFNGQAQPMGAYVYIIQINDADKGLITKKGTVTLIR